MTSTKKPIPSLDDELEEILAEAISTNTADGYLKAHLAIKSLLHTRTIEARIDEAKFWEYNIIPAVRSAQVEHDYKKRLAELESLRDKEDV